MNNKSLVYTIIACLFVAVGCSRSYGAPPIPISLRSVESSRIPASAESSTPFVQGYAGFIGGPIISQLFPDNTRSATGQLTSGQKYFIDSSQSHIICFTYNGKFKCNGTLGYGQTGGLAGLENVSKVVAVPYNTCAQHSDEMSCWGVGKIAQTLPSKNISDIAADQSLLCVIANRDVTCSMVKGGLSDLPNEYFTGVTLHLDNLKPKLENPKKIWIISPLAVTYANPTIQENKVFYLSGDDFFKDGLPHAIQDKSYLPTVCVEDERSVKCWGKINVQIPIRNQETVQVSLVHFDKEIDEVCVLDEGLMNCYVGVQLGLFDGDPVINGPALLVYSYGNPPTTRLPESVTFKDKMVPNVPDILKVVAIKNDMAWSDLVQDGEMCALSKRGAFCWHTPHFLCAWNNANYDCTDLDAEGKTYYKQWTQSSIQEQCQMSKSTKVYDQWWAYSLTCLPPAQNIWGIAGHYCETPLDGSPLVCLDQVMNLLNVANPSDYNGYKSNFDTPHARAMLDQIKKLTKVPVAALPTSILTCFVFGDRSTSCVGSVSGRLSEGYSVLHHGAALPVAWTNGLEYEQPVNGQYWGLEIPISEASIPDLDLNLLPSEYTSEPTFAPEWSDPVLFSSPLCAELSKVFQNLYREANSIYQSDQECAYKQFPATQPQCFRIKNCESKRLTDQSKTIDFEAKSCGPTAKYYQTQKMIYSFIDSIKANENIFSSVIRHIDGCD